MTTDNTNTTRNDSLAARTDTWLQSFLVWSPGQRDIIKTVALVLMVLDHINLIFQLKQEWMFLAGRGAFPLFALVWGLNLSRHAHIRQPAINRLWGWGIIAQFAYYLAGFPWYEGNILFAFAVAAQVLTWCETRSGWRTAAAILLMALWGPLSGSSYGIAGLLMLAVSHRLYRAEDRAERLALVACLLAVIPALNLATSGCSGGGRSCDDGADRWSGVVCRKIITPFLARGFFPGILRLSSGCAGRSGAVTGVVSLTVTG
ncbi:F pilin acetylation protein [Shigella sonnei]|nr:F pilin acetylation protein [Shigella sonnei]